MSSHEIEHPGERRSAAVPPGDSGAAMAGLTVLGSAGETEDLEGTARVRIEAEAVIRYAAAVGETDPHHLGGELAPAMFVAVYAAPAVWPVVLAIADGREPLLHFAQQFEWGELVCCGDVIDTSARAGGVARRATGDFFTILSLSRNQRGEEVSRGSWTIVIPGSAT
jgi:hypothetical protein